MRQRHNETAPLGPNDGGDGGAVRVNFAPPAGPRLAGSGRTSLAVRIILLVVGVAVAVAAIAGVVGAAMIRSAAVDVTQKYLANQADVIAGELTGADSGDRIGLTKFTPVLLQQGISVVNVNSSGTVFGADTTVGAVAVEVAKQAGAAQLPAGESFSRAETVNGQSFLVEGRAVGRRGVVLVTAAASSVATERALQLRVLLALGIGLAAAVLGGLIVARLMSRPLRRTADLTRAMGAGSRDIRAPVAGPREVADVAAAVNELADALQRSESRQREFLASVSHELRTPLTAINGSAQAIADGIVPDTETAEVARTITAESARLERLVSDLLDLARLGADNFRLDPAPCDLTALMRDMAAVWQVRCERRGVPLHTEWPPFPVGLTTDARRVRQVLDGLAENAFRLLEAGRPLVLALFAAESVAIIAVRDGGPGLAPEDYPVAFEQGVLHDRYRGRRPVGAGLGLALAHSLVTRLGGRISAGPAPEGGVAMTIELPLDGYVRNL